MALFLVVSISDLTFFLWTLQFVKLKPPELHKAFFNLHILFPNARERFFNCELCTVQRMQETRVMERIRED